jgi:hypothetical protein
VSRVLDAGKDLRRAADLKRCQRDLYYLTTKKLGYAWNPEVSKGLTARLHKPLCRWLDKRRDEPFVAVFLGRWHHKTTLVIGQQIQDVLTDPYTYLFHFHSVLEEAERVVKENAHHLQHNKLLRALDPIGVRDDGTPFKVFPATNASKFYKTNPSPHFELRRPPERWSRFPTLLGKGANSEVTGAHSRKTYGDDIITGQTVLEGTGLQKVAAWWRNTVMPVTDDMIFRITGTTWADWGLYQEFIEDPMWHVVYIPAAISEPPEEIDWSQDKIILEPDDSFRYPVYGPAEYVEKQRKKLVILKKQMKMEFGPQLMLDPKPKEDRPWNKDTCEHFISAADAAGHGFICVFSDPAPAKFFLDNRQRDSRKIGGEKNWWANAVVKFRRKRNMLEVILLDGSRSRKWDLSQGFDEILRLRHKWKAHRFCWEAVGSQVPVYQKEAHEACKRNNQHLRYVKLENLHRTGAKQVYFAALCALARNSEFKICVETCDREFLKQFLQESQGWLPLPGGGNGLKYDDCANVVSFATDAGVKPFIPLIDDEEPWSPYRDREQEEAYDYDMGWIKW